MADSGSGIDDRHLNWVISSCDLCALEEALLLAEAAAAGGDDRPEIVVFSLGPDRVADALRKALAIGADRAVHLADAAFQGGDALADGRALAAAVAQEDCDLVLTGAQSDDLGQAATPAVIAEFLGRPYAWLVMAVEVEPGGRSVRVDRELEAGMSETLRLDLPAVLAIQAGINRPRFASLRGTLQARNRPLRRAECSNLGLDVSTVGAAGARMDIESVSLPPASAGCLVIEGVPGEAAAAELIAHLEREAVL